MPPRLKSLLLALSLVAAGCTSNAAQPSTTDTVISPKLEAPPEEVKLAIGRLADPNDAVRDAAEEWLVNRGVSSTKACFAALPSTTDPEKRARLEQVCRRIELAQVHPTLSSCRSEQWYLISKDGHRFGVEHDRFFLGAEPESPASPGAELPPPTEDPAIGACRLESTVYLAGAAGPGFSLQVRATCRWDWNLSPFEVTWESDQPVAKMEIRFEESDEGKRVVANPMDGETRTRTFLLDRTARSVCLEINATRLIERAALVERPDLTLRLFRCGDPLDGKTRDYTLHLEGSHTMTWDGEKLAVLRYVEVGPDEATRDLYYVSKERGLMAGRIRGYDLIRLRGDPEKSTSTSGHK